MHSVEVTKENFDRIMETNNIVFLDFWAPWCGPCRNFGPIFEEAAKKHPEIVFGKVNTEVEQELAGMFGIRSIPTIAAFREQVGIYFQPGALPAQNLSELIVKIKDLDMQKVKEELAKEDGSQK